MEHPLRTPGLGQTQQAVGQRTAEQGRTGGGWAVGAPSPRRGSALSWSGSLLILLPTVCARRLSGMRATGGGGRLLPRLLKKNMRSRKGRSGRSGVSGCANHSTPRPTVVTPLG